MVPGRARVRAVLGDQLPHARRREGRQDARLGLGAPINRDVGPGERREVRDERAAPPVLPRLADHEVRRGQLGQRNSARGVRRAGYPRSGRRDEAPAGGVHDDAAVVLQGSSGAPRRAVVDEREGRSEGARASPGARRRGGRQVHAADLPA